MGHPSLRCSSELIERCLVFQFADGDFYMPDAWSFSRRCYELVTCFMNDEVFFFLSSLDFHKENPVPGSTFNIGFIGSLVYVY